MEIVGQSSVMIVLVLADHSTDIEDNMSSYVIICDGGHDKGGGYGSFLVIGLDADGGQPEVVKHQDREPFGEVTNNEAEYLALIHALEMILREDPGKHSLIILSDSQLMLKQLTGEYEARAEKLRVLHAKTRELLKNFDYTLEWAARTMIFSVLKH